MLRPGGADDVTAGEVYANGIALDVVRGWLGATASDLDWDAFNDADDVDATRPRPERLGLGAKFLSHARATSLGGVSRKLGGAIARSAKRRRTDADETDSESEEASRKGAGSGGAGGGKKTGAPTTTKGMIGSGSRSDHARDASDASDSDEGGRAAAFTKRPAKKQRAPAWDPTKDVKCVGNAPGAAEDSQWDVVTHNGETDSRAGIAAVKAELDEATRAGDTDRILTLMGTLLALEGQYEEEGQSGKGKPQAIDDGSVESFG